MKYSPAATVAIKTPKRIISNILVWEISIFLRGISDASSCIDPTGQIWAQNDLPAINARTRTTRIPRIPGVSACVPRAKCTMPVNSMGISGARKTNPVSARKMMMVREIFLEIFPLVQRYAVSVVPVII